MPDAGETKWLGVCAVCLSIAALGACGDDSGAAGAAVPAFVTDALKPDTSCVYSAEASGALVLDVGTYDIATSGNGVGNACENPYRVHLQVSGNLPPTRTSHSGESNVLRLQDANVQLMTVDRKPLQFDQTNTALPNPFKLPTNGVLAPATSSKPSLAIATVEAIPTTYATSLNDYVGREIIAQIKLSGTTTGGKKIELEPFDFQIEICDGCLTMCQQAVQARKLTRADAVGDKCDDNSGTDDRICIDPNC